MRSRKEIEKDRESRSPVVKDFHITDITTELLLDIRDELVKLNDKEFVINSYGQINIKEAKE